MGTVDFAVVICPRRELLTMTMSMKLFRVAACGCVILKEFEYRSSFVVVKTVCEWLYVMCLLLSCLGRMIQCMPVGSRCLPCEVIAPGVQSSQPVRHGIGQDREVISTDWQVITGMWASRL